MPEAAPARDPIYWIADPEKGQVAYAPSRVVLSFEAGVEMLGAYNAFLSPAPMHPWPPFLNTVDAEIAARRQLHACLMGLKQAGWPR